MAAIFSSCTFVSASSKIFGSPVRKEFTGEVVERQFDLADFNEITLNGGADIEYSYGEPKVFVTTNEDVFEFLAIEVKDNELTIGFNKKLRNVPKIKIRIFSTDLEEIEVNGACNFSSSENLVSDKFELTVNGAGDFDITSLKTGKAEFEVNGAADAKIRNINCGELEMEINGAGKAKVAGSARKADLSISGAGDIDISGLDCSDVSKHVAGAGKIR